LTWELSKFLVTVIVGSATVWLWGTQDEPKREAKEEIVQPKVETQPELSPHQLNPIVEPKSFMYVVQPKDTLRDLCVSMLGRYNDAVIAEVRRLNPDVKDPTHLEVGQEIRLPIDSVSQ
jgi:hypothetical protein